MTVGARIQGLGNMIRPKGGEGAEMMPGLVAAIFFLFFYFQFVFSGLVRISSY